MPILKSTKKRLRTSLRAQIRNRSARSALRTAIKQIRDAEDRPTAEAALSGVVSIIDRSVKKKILHRNTAARHKSRLTRLVQTME